MQAIQLKATCDSCVASKVKCSGTQPCTRCSLKGFDCFYRPRKKRTRAKKPIPAVVKLETIESKDQNEILNQITNIAPDTSHVPFSGSVVQKTIHSDGHFINAQARRSWAVFFMLYKNYNASCSRFWFDQQLAKIHRYLTKTNNKESLKQLNAWMESMDIDYASLNDYNSPCMVAIRNNQNLLKTITEYKAPHFHIRGDLHTCHPATQHDQADAGVCIQEEKEYLKEDFTKAVSVHYHSGMADDDVIVQVSHKFSDLFGTTGDVITKEVKEFGILPYGVDVFANIMSEDDLLALIQILVIKANSFKCSMTANTSIIRQIPSCHVFDLKTIKSARTIPFMIKMVHRQVINVSQGIQLDFTAILEPLQPIPENESNLDLDQGFIDNFLIGSSATLEQMNGNSSSASSYASSVSSPYSVHSSSTVPLTTASGVGSGMNSVGSPSTQVLSPGAFAQQHQQPSNAISTSELSELLDVDFDEKELADPGLADDLWLDGILKWTRGAEAQ